MPRQLPLLAFSPAEINQALEMVLEGIYAPPDGLQEAGIERVFSRRQDDNDGGRGPEHNLAVSFTRDGDAWFLVPWGENPQSALRFRTDAGGGASPRVHRALMILAEAIRRDNEDRPQPPMEYGLPGER